MTDNVEPPARRPALLASTGHICFWQGGSLWVGRGGGRSDRHAHHAHQIAVSLEGNCMFRGEPDAEWIPYAGAVSPSRRSHEFEFSGAIAHLFVEPETPQGRALGRSCAQSGISPLAADACMAVGAMLRNAESGRVSGDALVAIGKSALSLLTGTLGPGAAVDARVEKAIKHVGVRVREAVSLADAAAVVSLSPGRFRHLFVQETGTPFRAYLLWMRLNVALRFAMEGATWTSAAHEAGFSDSAHFSRTFKRMFGINPAELANLPRQK